MVSTYHNFVSRQLTSCTNPNPSPNPNPNPNPRLVLLVSRVAGVYAYMVAGVAGKYGSHELQAPPKYLAIALPVLREDMPSAHSRAEILPDWSRSSCSKRARSEG